MNHDPIDRPEQIHPNTGAATGATSRKRFLRAVLMLLVPLIAAAVLLAFYLRGGREVETDNAYVKADKIPVSAEVAGPVVEVLVRDNEPVPAGKLLFRVDATPFRVAVAAAKARLTQARTDLAALGATHRQKQAEIALARTRLDFARQEQQRQSDLVARGFISTARFDEARQTRDLAAQQIAVLEQELQRIAVTLGGDIDAPMARHPSMLAAQAALDRAGLDLARTEIRAALPGIVSRPPRRGQFIGVGTVAMALVISDAPWVEANFAETDLTHLRPGQAAVVHLDTYPGFTWRGRVDSLSPATGSEFALIPAQNATGNWVKVVQRVPVRIHLEVEPGQPVLRAGLSAKVIIETGQKRRLFGLAWPAAW
ncbi:MAG: HlyD family secretion protein [Burkholderiaceae bacterium]|nr:HlyD family secretion protein [Burkholderiaceae bacterium]